jgi:beta-xylosidase
MGPYEDKIVLHQGDSVVNGPHQGGYVELDSGESWFLHFQDREAYGRIVHLQPMRWENDWPVMGIDTNGDGVGEPVLVHQKPDVGLEWPFAVPEMNDEFDQPVLGLQWQWQANRKAEWASLAARPGHLRLFAKGASTLYEAPNVLCQKIPAPVFTATTKLDFTAAQAYERAGLTVFGHDYRYIALESTGKGMQLVFIHGKGNKETSSEETAVTVQLPDAAKSVYFRVQVVLEATCTFQYSLDGEQYVSVGDPFEAVPGGWVGAKLGLFCLQLQGAGESAGYADFDWFRFE